MLTAYGLVLLIDCCITEASISEPERSGDDAIGARRVSVANQQPGAGNLHAGMLRHAQHRSGAGFGSNPLSYADGKTLKLFLKRAQEEMKCLNFKTIWYNWYNMRIINGI
jgi:hypothetical protein